MTRLPEKFKHVHLVGIGGAGMSAIARVLVQDGLRVTGSDLRSSSVTNSLTSAGIPVSIGHSAANCAGADMLVVSAAVPEDNVEVVAGRDAGVPVLPRGKVLAMLVADERTIGVTGTHGKSTTSGMVVTILDRAGFDPTYLIGADLPATGSGAHRGKGDIAVVEADEAYGSFLHLEPSVAVITNIDRDHLDFYGSYDALTDAFASFARSASKVVACADDPAAMKVASLFDPMTFGTSDDADVLASDVTGDASGSDLTISHAGRSIDVRLNVGGHHNVLNALGAAAACLAEGVELAQIAKGLAAFRGVARRFEFKGRVNGADVVDDYAHHPTELLAVLTAAKAGSWGRVFAVFQPHLYSRTRDLSADFGSALALADVVVVTDVYAARESPIPGITGKLIVDAVCEARPSSKVAYMPSLQDAEAYVLANARSGDVVLTIGAGDITTLSSSLAEQDGA